MAISNWTLATLAARLGVKCVGDSSIRINGLAALSEAKPDQLSFLANPRYRAQLRSTRAGAVIVAPGMEAECPVPTLITDQPYLLYAHASHLFDNRPGVPEGVDPSAVIGSGVTMGQNCRIGPGAIIGTGTQLGDGVEIGAGTVIGAHCKIGNHVVLHARVTLYHDITMGDRCQIHAGVVIGADGFGFAKDSSGWVKIAQLGGVTIGNDVEIGANTTIDRGALHDTQIGSGVILDNQIQIAHNVEIGEGTAIAGCTGIAGSTTIGKHCTIAGAVGIAGHLTIVDHVHITMRSAITKDIKQPGSYSSGTAMSDTQSWRKNAARFRQLDSMARKIAELETKLRCIEEKDS